MIFKNITFSGKRNQNKNYSFIGTFHVTKCQKNVSVWLIHSFFYLLVCLGVQSHTPRLLCRKRSLEAFWWLVQVRWLAENLRCQENKQVRCQGAGYHIACCCQILNPAPTFLFSLSLDTANLPVKVDFQNDSLEVDGIGDLFVLPCSRTTLLVWA